MELSIKSLFMYGAVVLTGLSAGLFYAWSVSVIPGTQKIDDPTYLNTMQSINRAILNPAFFLVFFGSMAFQVIAVIITFDSGSTVFWLLLASSIFYLVGTIGMTGLGNVPLNNQLDGLNLAEIQHHELFEFRRYYESNWNRLHSIRTMCAVIAFLLSTLAVFIQMKH